MSACEFGEGGRHHSTRNSTDCLAWLKAPRQIKTLFSSITLQGLGDTSQELRQRPDSLWARLMVLPPRWAH